VQISKSRGDEWKQMTRHRGDAEGLPIQGSINVSCHPDGIDNYFTNLSPTRTMTLGKGSDSSESRCARLTKIRGKLRRGMMVAPILADLV
jgi:hypothetical protein